MSWTYRVVRRVVEGEVSYGIHEAYDEGDVDQPHSVTTEPCAPVGESTDELDAVLDRMKAALKKRPLEYDAFKVVHP